MNGINKLSRIAGLLYLGVIVFGVFAEAFVRMNILVSGDAEATTRNIIDNEVLYKIGFISDILMILCFLFLPLAFFELFKDVERRAASIMVILVLVSIPLMLVTMMLYFSPLFILDGTHFAVDQQRALTMLTLDLYHIGVEIGTIFHGLWLFPLGYLVHRSGYFPKFIGILLMIACFSFPLQTVVSLLLPSNLEFIAYPGYIIAIVAEFGFCGYLLFRGAIQKTITTVVSDTTI